ncbi:PfkB family carbohydrate kinase [Pseudofrankia sp. DC12]|uniref:PfkB family carbohydrate kinase n=1 Tax=Pseudofrankia sp. DC12 TaxID=683315 RepID=UPI0005F80089|nr:PfkB family carbohydrate kinase [Pseudofrankia sp. DC12]
MSRAEPASARRSISGLRLVVVGSYHADLLMSTPRLPDWGDDLRPESVRTVPGGKGLNLAVTLARAGTQVTAVGVLGTDAVGSSLLATLVTEGVDVTAIARQPAAATPVCLVFTAPDGRTAFVWRRPDEYAITPEVLGHAKKAIAGADAVLLTFEAAEAFARVVEISRAQGTLVIVNPGPAPEDRRELDAVRWDLVDVLVPNESEARALLPPGHPARTGAAERLADAVGRALGVPLVCVTLAERGCVVFDGATTRAYPAHVTEVVDTTAASDAFTAVFAACHLAGLDQAEAVDRAQAAAARTVTRPGAYEALPTRADLAH